MNNSIPLGCEHSADQLGMFRTILREKISGRKECKILLHPRQITDESLNDKWTQRTKVSQIQAQIDPLSQLSQLVNLQYRVIKGKHVDMNPLPTQR